MARPRRKQKYKFLAYADSRSPFKSWQEFQDYNKTQPCNNPACNQKRHNRSKWCASCGRYYRMLGHPQYRPIKPAQYKAQVKIAQEVITFNPKNVIITDFCEKWETLAVHGRQGLPIEWATYWAEIHGVINHKSNIYRRDAKTVLAYLTGLYMFYSDTGNEFIKNEKMYHFTIADIALRGCKLAVRPKATGKRMRKFGKFIWSAFSIYWLKLAYATMQNEKLKQIRAKELKEAVLQLPAK